MSFGEMILCFNLIIFLYKTSTVTHLALRRHRRPHPYVSTESSGFLPPLWWTRSHPASETCLRLGPGNTRNQTHPSPSNHLRQRNTESEPSIEHTYGLAHLWRTSTLPDTYTESPFLKTLWEIFLLVASWFA